MARSESTNGLLLLVTLAGVGVLLVFVPGRVLEQYQHIKQLGPVWANTYLALVGTGGAILTTLAGMAIWKVWSGTRQKKLQQIRAAKNPSELSDQELQQEVADNLASAQHLGDAAAVPPQTQAHLQQLAKQVEQKQESQRLEIVAFGTVSSGKSSLLNALAGRDAFQTDLQGGTTIQRQEIPWPGNDKVTLVDTPGLGEIDGAEHVSQAAAAAQTADVVLLVIDGPLRSSEFLLLSRLAEMEKRVLVCLNKADWYSPTDQGKLLGQVREQLKEVVLPDDLIPVRSQQVSRTRVRILADGSESEEAVPLPADIAPLAARMLAVVQRDGQSLLLANLLLQSRGLVEQAKQDVKAALDKRAWELVDRYTWGAGAAAALSPFPLLDLFAGTAITTKMVVDLAAVYKQPVDTKTAISLLAQLGKNFIAIFGANLAAPALAAAVASLLKTIPLAGQLVGGMLQGVVQALVTRWIGGVFVQYFQNEMQQPDGGLANLARREWQRLTAPAELAKFIQQARQRLSGKAPE